MAKPEHYDILVLGGGKGGKTLAMAAAIMIAGSGAFSVDGILYRRTSYWWPDPTYDH